LIGGVIPVLGFFGYATANDLFKSSPTAAPAPAQNETPQKFPLPDWQDTDDVDASEVPSDGPASFDPGTGNDDYYTEMEASSLTRAIAALLIIEGSPGKVTCPGGIGRHIGDTQQCVLSRNGKRYAIDVTRVSEEEDESTLRLDISDTPLSDW
jgi:hypothetical protein